MAGAGTRLERAISKRRATFNDVAAFARAVGEKPGTVIQQIHRDSIPGEKAAKYAKKLKVPLGWLINNEGPDPFPQNELSTAEDVRVNDSAANRAYDVLLQEAEAGGDNVVLVTEGEEIVFDMLMDLPRPALRRVLRAAVGRIAHEPRETAPENPRRRA